MDNFADERDYKVLEQDKYTFFVLRRILGDDVMFLSSDHERLIVCSSKELYPVWIWTPDDVTKDEMDKAYELADENGFLNGTRTINLKHELADYFIERAAEEGKELAITMNLMAYDCPTPIEPKAFAEGSLHHCTMEDIDEVMGIVEAFHAETGVDKKSKEQYREEAIKHIESNGLYFWKDKSGKNVASCKWYPNDDMAAVNLVYTKPEVRRFHYAETLVYMVTKMAYDQGFVPMLYTNADYVASNACYKKIGYVLRGELCTIGRKTD